MDADRTAPKPRFPKGVKPDPATLTAGRYGTQEMVDIFGPEQTFADSLYVQGVSSQVISDLYPEHVPPEHAREIMAAATLDVIDPNRIRELEEETGHDVIAINRALEERIRPAAAAHVNRLKTSSGTTEPAKALQLKQAMEVIADSTQNLRDITLERARDWSEVPHMDTTHWYDAVPSVAGRPFAYFAEMLQSGLEFLRFVHEFSSYGIMADATGCHHSATALDIDGMRIEDEFCNRLGLNHMIAPAQIPGREFIVDVMYALTRLGESVHNQSRYVRWGRSSDVGLFTFPRGKKGSSAMPHKDAHGGNPTAEEQAASSRNYLHGVLATSLSSASFEYGRSLDGSASDRITIEDGFKFADHTIRRMASVMSKLSLNEERSRERVERSYGVSTTPWVTACLTDARRGNNPMTRDDAHNYVANLAQQAYDQQRPFADVLLEDVYVRDRIGEDTIRQISNPLNFTGLAREQIGAVFAKYHGKKAFQ